MSVPSSELVPPAQASVAPPLDPKGWREQHSLAGEEVGGTQIRRLDSGLKALYSVYSVIEMEVLRRMCDSGTNFLCVYHSPTSEST